MRTDEELSPLPSWGKKEKRTGRGEEGREGMKKVLESVNNGHGPAAKAKS